MSRNGPLAPLVKPTDEQLKTMTVEEAQEIDAKNQEIWASNKTMFDHAKRIAEELDPTNRQIRNMELPPPTIDVTAMVMERIEREKDEAESGTG